MLQNRLLEASDELRSRIDDFVERTSEPGTGQPENAQRQCASQTGSDAPAPAANDTASALVYELGQRPGSSTLLPSQESCPRPAAEQARLATEVIRQLRQVSYRCGKMLMKYKTIAIRRGRTPEM
jgi:hypothetical protein